MTAQGNVWSAAITMSFPFFNGLRTHGQVIQSVSNLETARLDETKLRESVALQIRQAIDNVKESAAILTALSGTVQEAERLLVMSEKGFELGVKTRLDVEDAQLNLTLAKGNLAQARRDYIVARTNLDWAMGILGE